MEFTRPTISDRRNVSAEEALAPGSRRPLRVNLSWRGFRYEHEGCGAAALANLACLINGDRATTSLKAMRAAAAAHLLGARPGANDAGFVRWTVPPLEY